MNYGVKTGVAWLPGTLPKQSGHHWAFIFINMIRANLKTVFLCVCALQVFPTSGPIRGSTLVTMCGHNFGFDKTENFKTSLVTVEVAGAPCKLPRQDYINRFVCAVLEASGVFVFVHFCASDVCLCIDVFYMPLHFKDRWGRRLFLSLNHGVNWWCM